LSYTSLSSFSVKPFALFTCFSFHSMLSPLKWSYWTYLMMNIFIVISLIQHSTPDFLWLACHLCVSIVLTYLSHKFAVFSDLTLQRGKLKNVLTAHGVMNMYGKWPIKNASVLYFCQYSEVLKAYLTWPYYVTVNQGFVCVVIIYGYSYHWKYYFQSGVSIAVWRNRFHIDLNSRKFENFW
jgi:hypothetical protein